MKKEIISFVAGAVLFGTAGVFAGQYTAVENPFPVQLNGEEVSVEGYNIDGSTYFKLRDIADIVGGFTVDFFNNTIQLAKDGYVYDNTAVTTENDKAVNALKEYAKNVKSFYYDTFDFTYGNIKFMLTDVTGDDIPELLAASVDEDIINYIEVFRYHNGEVERIMNYHCQAANGGYVTPIKYDGRTYIMYSSYSSATGFKNWLVLYENDEWTTKLWSNVVIDYMEGVEKGYDVNGKDATKAEYEKFNDTLWASAYAPWEFVTAEEL